LKKLPLTRSAIRWYNDFEVGVEITLVFTFESVRLFCRRDRRFRVVADDDDDDYFQKELAALDKKLSDFFDTEDSGFKLELELLLFCQYGRPLAQACYLLEGDGPTLPYVAQHLTRCQQHLNPSTAVPLSSFGRLTSPLDTPLDAKVLSFLQERVDEAQIPNWTAWCRERINPAHVYMARQEVKHDVAYRIARAAELFLPWRFVERAPLGASVKEKLHRFNLSDVLINLCVESMATYRALATGVVDTIDLLPFWLSHKDSLPAWYEAFILVGLTQASSAAAERGFSVFENLIGRGNLPQATEETMETQMKAKMNKDSV
jgi:hypothetical protein